MGKSIVRELKELYSSTRYEDGKKRPVYIGKMYNVNMSFEREQLIDDIIYLLSKSDVISEPTKMFIFGRSRIVSDVTIEYNNIHKMYVDDRYIYNKIQYDSRKLAEIVSVDDLNNIVGNPSVSIDTVRLRVNDEIRRRFIGSDSVSLMGIQLDNSRMIRYFDGDFISKYGDIIYTYSKSRMDDVEKELNKDDEFIGYFNYLVSGLEMKNETDIENRNRLFEILKGKKVSNVEASSRQVDILSNTASSKKDNDNVVETTKVEIIPKKQRIQF